MEQFDKWDKCAALMAELEPMVRNHQKEISSAGSLILIKNSLHELQKKMNETVLKEDLKKVQDQQKL